MAVDDVTLRRNHLLASLPPTSRSQLAGIVELRPFDIGASVYEQDEPIGEVVFPLNAVFSLVTVMDEGPSVEIATVGNEGFVGLPVFLQAALTSQHRAIAQIAGEALCISAAEFARLGNSGGPLQSALQRYAQALITQIAQGSACNRLHSIEQRCARWLLLTHDRVGDAEFGLTQEFLGQMLGAGRTSVNAAAQALQSDGLIQYTRGRVRVLDRPGMEAAVCECYWVIRREFERLLGEPRG